MPIKLMVRVRPGVELTWASFCTSRELIRLDFPTFERPRKANSGGPSAGKPPGLAAEIMNLARTGFIARTASTLRRFLLRLDGLPLRVGEHIAVDVERAGAFQQCAAIHDNEFAVDVARVVADQKRRQVRQLFMRAKASDRAVLLGFLFQLLHGKQPRKRAFGWDRAGTNSVEPDSALAPFHRKTAGHGEHASFSDGRRYNISRPEFGICSGYVQDVGFVAFFEPAPAAGHGYVNSAHEHDSDDCFICAGREVFCPRDKVAGGVVDQNIQRAIFPDGVDHCFHALRVTHVARERFDGPARSFAEFVRGLLEDFLATSADIQRGAEFKKTLSHALAQPSCAAGDENALARKQIVLEHMSLRETEVNQPSYTPGTTAPNAAAGVDLMCALPPMEVGAVLPRLPIPPRCGCGRPPPVRIARRSAIRVQRSVGWRNAAPAQPEQSSHRWLRKENRKESLRRERRRRRSAQLPMVQRVRERTRAVKPRRIRLCLFSNIAGAMPATNSRPVPRRRGPPQSLPEVVAVATVPGLPDTLDRVRCVLR